MNKAESMARRLFDYLSHPNDTASKQDLMDVLKIIIPAISEGKNDETVARAVADEMYSQLLRRGAVESTNYVEEEVHLESNLRKVDEYFMKKQKGQGLISFVYAFRHDYHMRAASRHYKTIAQVCSCEKKFVCDLHSVQSNKQLAKYEFFAKPLTEHQHILRFDNRRYSRASMDMIKSIRKESFAYNSRGFSPQKEELQSGKMVKKFREHIRSLH